MSFVHTTLRDIFVAIRINLSIITEELAFPRKHYARGRH